MKTHGKWIEDGTLTDAKLAANAVTTAKILDSNVTGAKLDSTAKQAVLESKLIARRTGVLTFATGGAVGSNTVTTEVEAAATTDVPQTALTAKGIYTGAVANAADQKKVVIRQSGYDNGIDDGTGDDVYGVLSESAGVYTLTYYKADGTAYTFAADTNIDFFFVEVFDMYSQPVDASLIPVSGVVDATQASAILNHINSVEAHDADSIDYESTAHTKKNIQPGSTKVESAISDLDEAIGVLNNNPTNYTPGSSAIVGSHLHAIDLKIGTMDGKIADIGQDQYEVFTLTSTDITNGYVDLTGVPKLKESTIVQPEGGPVQFYTDDYTIITDGSEDKRLNWNGLGMDGVLEVGDKLRILYEVAA